MQQLKMETIRMLTNAYKEGQRSVIERYRKDNPSAYDKHRTYWELLSKAWGLEDE